MRKTTPAALFTAALACAQLAAPIASAQGIDSLTGRVWVETAPANKMPGTLLVFFNDGTLLMDSCWETYALRRWKRTAPDALSWDEDGATVSATVAKLTATDLTLKVKAGRDVVEHRYARPKVPFVCPDMKR
ncbi:hypothetical protein [Ancylobacter pratisalsi]|uniref:Uncharacterized protein n=1 Tax=Ancylobacter pratisalsi TaxID=1745854 RepID=A0A6P1YPJ7_9HYPH|nr:hypothetical protein [Ancylobacter pratisalsi]QIB34073.1 hypothetical protein G3A50_10370 [Ancylobacter pratisalsi]